MAEIGTFTSGSVLTAAELNKFGNVTALYKDGNQSVATGVADNVTFASGDVVIDVSGWHSTDKIQPDIEGYYLVGGGCTWNESALNDYICNIAKNGNNIGCLHVLTGDFFPGTYGATVTYMNGTTHYVHNIISTTSGITRTARRFSLFCALLRTA